MLFPFAILFSAEARNRLWNANRILSIFMIVMSCILICAGAFTRWHLWYLDPFLDYQFTLMFPLLTVIVGLVSAVVHCVGLWMISNICVQKLEVVAKGLKFLWIFEIVCVVLAAISVVLMSTESQNINSIETPLRLSIYNKSRSFLATDENDERVLQDLQDFGELQINFECCGASDPRDWVNITAEELRARAIKEGADPNEYQIKGLKLYPVCFNASDQKQKRPRNAVDLDKFKFPPSCCNRGCFDDDGENDIWFGNCDRRGPEMLHSCLSINKDTLTACINDTAFCGIYRKGCVAEVTEYMRIAVSAVLLYSFLAFFLIEVVLVVLIRVAETSLWSALLYGENNSVHDYGEAFLFQCCHQWEIETEETANFTGIELRELNFENIDRNISHQEAQ